MRALLTGIVVFALFALAPVAAESIIDVAYTARVVVTHQSAAEHAYAEHLKKLQATSRGRHVALAASSD